MIKYVKEDILKIEADAIVNSVNLKGVMGKGLALAFKNAFPENFKLYKKACSSDIIKIGKLFITETGRLFPKYIINFPTKDHWRFPSKYEYIEAGLEDLKNWLRNNGIKSIAIPPLGSGNGRLDWPKVKKMIIESLAEFKDNLEIIIVEPSNQFNYVVEKTKQKSELTPARAMLLYLMRKYQIMGYEVNFLVTQKLSYFLQRFNEPLKLRFEKGYYGPFASNLIPVLNVLNNNFIKFKNYNENKPSTTIRLITERQNEVDDFILNKLSDKQKERLEKTLDFINGFETPFGLELLGTIDFIFREHKNILSTEKILKELQNWTNRKVKLFKPAYIDSAKERLQTYFDYQ